MVQNTRIILLPPTPPLSLSCLKGFKSKQKHEQTKLKSWQKNSRLDTATAQEIRTPKLPAAPNAEHGQGRRKEEALGLSLQSVTESVDQFTAAAAHRRTSFWAVTELLSPLAAERSQPGSGKWMHRTSTLTSRKTQDNGMQTANFYQFNCALRLAVKPPLEKYHPGVSNQKVLIFFFLYIPYDFSVQLSIISESSRRRSSSSFPGSKSISASSFPPEISQISFSKSSSTDKGAFPAPVELSCCALATDCEEAEAELESPDCSTESAWLPSCSSRLGETRKRTISTQHFVTGDTFSADQHLKPLLPLLHLKCTQGAPFVNPGLPAEPIN